MIGSFAVPGRADDATLQKIAGLTEAPHFRHAHWGYLFVDRQSGQVLLAHGENKLFAPASVTKCFSVACALDTLGADHRFHTILRRRGDVSGDGQLDGDLVLVASGDLTFSGRTNERGEIAYTNVDHIYANWLDDAALTAPNPLAGLDELARQVAGVGIRQIKGNVLVDTRLFDAAEGTGSGPSRLSPILINDNVVDLVIEPTQVGQPAKVTSRPETSVVRVESRIETVEASQKLQTWIRAFPDGRIVLTGKMPVGRRPLTRIADVPDPAGWARSLLIEALRRRGIEVAAAPALAHPAVEWPTRDEVARLPPVAELISPPFSESVRLILKVSHNLHASTLPLLVAVQHGQHSLADGMRWEGDFLRRVGVDGISFGGGAGGARSDYVTPVATVALLRYMAGRPDFAVYARGLPILGVDGTLAESVGADSPVRGQVRAKTGTLTWENGLDGSQLLTSKSMAGYMTTSHGRELAFALFVNGVLLRDGLDAKQVGRELGQFCEIVHAAY